MKKIALVVLLFVVSATAWIIVWPPVPDMPEEVVTSITYHGHHVHAPQFWPAMYTTMTPKILVGRLLIFAWPFAGMFLVAAIEVDEIRKRQKGF